MQVGPAYSARHTDFAQLLALVDVLSFFNIDLVQVAIHGDQSIAVIDKYRVPREKIVPGTDDGAAGRGDDGRADWRGDIQTGMPANTLLVVVDSFQAKRAAETTFNRCNKGCIDMLAFTPAVNCRNDLFLFTVMALNVFLGGRNHALVTDSDVGGFIFLVRYTKFLAIVASTRADRDALDSRFGGQWNTDHGFPVRVIGAHQYFFLEIGDVRFGLLYIIECDNCDPAGIRLMSGIG